MKHTISLVFFGSGPVAAKSLQLLRSDFAIEAIITKPATVADMQKICTDQPVYAVSKKSELDALIAQQDFHSQVAVLVDFGIIVSKFVIEKFKHGIINSHFSLLPLLRGADPITFAILEGLERTGVSIMLLSEGMDEGPLLAQAPYDIPLNATTPILTEELIKISNAALQAIIPPYLAGTVIPKPQDEASIIAGSTPTYSQKITKQQGIIDWSKSAVQIEREVRAFIGWPQSHTSLAHKEVIITEAGHMSEMQGKPGTPIVSGKKLYVYCGDGALEIKRLKPIGKKDMPAEAFLAGHKL